MDLLDFAGEEMYFDQPLPEEAARLIDEAAERYQTPRGGTADAEDGDDGAERCLLRAYFLAPEHLSVLVSLYRFFFYRQRYDDALRVADRAVAAACRSLQLDQDWRTLGSDELAGAAQRSMTTTRFLLLALKGAAWLLLRQHRPAAALERLAPVAAFDTHDRLGHKVLQSWAEKAALRDELAARGDNVHPISG